MFPQSVKAAALSESNPAAQPVYVAQVRYRGSPAPSRINRRAGARLYQYPVVRGSVTHKCPFRVVSRAFVRQHRLDVFHAGDEGFDLIREALVAQHGAPETRNDRVQLVQVELVDAI